MLRLVDHAEAVGLDLAQDAVSAYVLTVAIAAHVNPLAMKSELYATSQRISLVSARGFEPPRPFGHQLLRLARLPFRHADIPEIIYPRSSEVPYINRIDLISGGEIEDLRVEIQLPFN